MITAQTRETERRSGSMYASIWRWHFYAAFLVVPFLILQSLTGAVYLFKPQIDPLGESEKYSVVAAGEKISYDEQLQVVRHEAGDSFRILAFDVPTDREGSTSFMLAGKTPGQPVTAYVDPYSGKYLGMIDENGRVSEIAKRIHGTLLLGNAGSVVIELGASWALVMILTGLYLWWPRGKFRLWGTLLPRLRSSGRGFWKDLHQVAGVYLSFFALFFIITGLPWAIIWGAGLKGFQQLTGQVASEVDAEEHLAHGQSGQSGHAGHAGHSMGGQEHGLSTQQVVELAAKEDLPGPLRVFLPKSEGGTYSVQNMALRTRDRQTLKIDPASGKIVGRRGWSDLPIVPKFVNTGVDLHEGRFFGLPNQIANLLVALSLIWMAVTGVVMWWKRRPVGKLAAPPRSRLAQLPVRIGACIVVLSVLLPTVGASIVLMWLFDRLVAPRVGWLKPASAG